MAKTWETIERPGYSGARRDARLKAWDETYGKGNWRIVWKIGDQFVDYLGACALYEDAYFAFMTGTHPEVTSKLVAAASNIYDDAPSNVDSGFDYTKQETNRTHIQDIAIRRVLLRAGLWFRGPELIQIRHSVGKHPLSMTLSPGKIPFHRPDLLEPAYDRPNHERWYDDSSVEDFYQRNKYLQVRR